MKARCAAGTYIGSMTALLRHIRTCHNARLPGRRLPFRLDGQQVGWVLPDLARRAAEHGAGLDESGLALEAASLPALARALADAGAFPWRGEVFDVRAEEDGLVLAQVDRGALPKFGIMSVGVHVNGLVGDQVWVGFRAANKLLDPGKLDHLVAGGIPAGYGVADTLEKEAEEEASIPAEMIRTARPVATLRYAMEREEGLRRDLLHCFDLELPPDFTPVPRDGEVSHFELWPLPRVLQTLERGDDFKFNVALVLIDLLLRRRVIEGEAASVLREALQADGGGR